MYENYFCTLCSTEIKNCNFAKHAKSCDGQGPFFKRKRFVSSSGLICIFCNKESNNANGHRHHERLCPKNSGRVYKSQTIGLTAWNKGLTKETDTLVAKYGETTSKTLANKPATGCCAWTTEQRSNAAKDRGFGGYRENAGRSKKFSVIDSFGKQTTLQSTFELRCSEILNELGVRWVRPKALKYDGRNYFADFYLVDCDVWLDPKNNFKAKQDEEKIRKVIEQNNVKLYVLLEHQLTKEYIAGII